MPNRTKAGSCRRPDWNNSCQFHSRSPRAGNSSQAETELFGFAVSGHPLELFPDVAWDTYCPVNRLGEYVGETVTTCGLVVEQRTHHQITGEPMKFLTLADWTGMVETELFAQTYKSYGLATVRYPVLEVEARVEPFENGRASVCAFSARDNPALFADPRDEVMSDFHYQASDSPAGCSAARYLALSTELHIGPVTPSSSAHSKMVFCNWR